MFLLFLLSFHAMAQEGLVPIDEHQEATYFPKRRKKSKRTKTHNLEESQVESFNEMKADLKKIYEDLAKEEIKKAPEKREEIINFYNVEYRKRVFVLAEEYKQGKIELVRKWKSPSLVGTIPSGYGTGWGSIFMGGALSFNQRTNNEKDWNLVMGFGTLDSAKWVSLTFALVIDSVSSKGSQSAVDNFKFRGKLFDRGGLNLKVSRMLFSDTCSAGVGYDHALHWGMDAEAKHFLRATNLAVSCIFSRAPINRFANTFMTTLGLGDRTFQTYDRWAIHKQSGIGFFGGVGVRMWQFLSFFLETRKKELHAGMSLAPFPNFPWTLNLAMTNLTKRDSMNRPLIFSGVMSHRF